MTHLTAQDDKPWEEWTAGKGAHEELGDYGVLIVLLVWGFCLVRDFFLYAFNIFILQEIIYDQFISICWNNFRFLSALNDF